jgi:hypothetical protein
MPQKSIKGFNLYRAVKLQINNIIQFIYRIMKILSPDRPGEIFWHLNIQFIADRHLWVVTLEMSY